jgi:hypothetical protein
MPVSAAFAHPSVRVSGAGAEPPAVVVPVLVVDDFEVLEPELEVPQAARVASAPAPTMARRE